MVVGKWKHDGKGYRRSDLREVTTQWTPDSTKETEESPIQSTQPPQGIIKKINIGNKPRLELGIVSDFMMKVIVLKKLLVTRQRLNLNKVVEGYEQPAKRF